MHNYNWFVDRLREFGQYANVETRLVGQSKLGYYIFGIDIIPENEPVGQIVVVSGHHGTEPAGPEAAIKFIEKVLDSETTYAKELKKNYRISVVPIVNVDQYVLPPNRRFYDNANSHYNDIEYGFSNREHAYPETIAAAYFLLSRNNVDRVITFDLHETPESWFTGFEIMENLQKPRNNYSRYAIKNLQSEGYPIYSSSRVRNGVSKKHYDGTFMEFSYKNGVDAYTFESPVIGYTGCDIPLEARVEMHLIAMDAILSKILDEKKINDSVNSKTGIITWLKRYFLTGKY